MHTRNILAVTALALCSTSVWADDSFAVGARVGTTGVGLDFIYPASSSLSIRLSGATYNKSYDTTSANVQYNGKLKLNTIGLLADYFPGEGSFRFTAGLIKNNNKFELTGQAVGGSYTINNTTYTAAQAGSVTGTVDFPSTAPYLGIGWGAKIDNKSNIHFIADIGIMFQGSPKANVTATGAAANPALASDVNAAQDKLRDDVKNYRYYPVLGVGIAMSF
jgi:hypothetical protein